MVQFARTPLPERPRLAPWVTWFDLGDDRLQFRSAEFTYLTLRHRFFIELFQRTAPLLTGERTAVQIAEALGDGLESTTVDFMLQMLAANGLLQAAELDESLSEDERVRWDRQLRFLSRLTANAPAAQAQLARVQVGAIVVDELGGAIASELTSAGVAGIREIDSHVLDSGEVDVISDLDLLVAAQERPGFALFDTINTACLNAGTRWMHVAAVGRAVRVGPTFIPHQTACYTCYDRRRRAHESDLDSYQAYRDAVAGRDGIGDEGMLAPLRTIVAGQVAIEVVRLLTAVAPPTTLGRLYEFDAITPVPTSHEVLRVPRCPSCARQGPMYEAWESAGLVASGRS